MKATAQPTINVATGPSIGIRVLTMHNVEREPRETAASGSGTQSQRNGCLPLDAPRSGSTALGSLKSRIPSAEYSKCRHDGREARKHQDDVRYRRRLWSS